MASNFGSLKWYDARINDPTRSAEFRLYYTNNEVTLSASIEDLLIIGQTTNDELIVIIAQKGSTAEEQLLWLFDLQEVENKFILKDLSQEKSDLGFAAKYIISSLGIEIECDAVVLTNGTFLNGLIHIGEKRMGGGRTGEKAATGLTEQLVELGFEAGRMKTGTPPV